MNLIVVMLLDEFKVLMFVVDIMGLILRFWVLV